MRHVHILLGIAQGMTCSEDFKLYYNWLSPFVFPFVNKIMDVFTANDQIALIIFKLLAELANNRSHRFSNFAMKSTNCLVIFKESAEIFMKYFQNQFVLKTSVRDAYKEKYKHIDIFSRFLANLLSGNFVNFAVCSFYGD